MGNRIDQYAIGELLDGRYFFIPAYQRGYRWTEKQVGDLLRDLLSFANDDKKKDYDFYCLQPVIARPITNSDKIAALFGEGLRSSVLEKGAWEIIDGQQRLTTLFLIFRYLIRQRGWSASALYEMMDGAEEYHIVYATRKGSSAFLEGLSLDSLDNLAGDPEKDNIDFFHMGKAFKYIDSWFKTEGKEINKRFGLGGDVEDIQNTIRRLLGSRKGNKKGSVQVLWYQLEENEEKSSIKEFQKINTGKIKLTDAELIKGLFLMSRNFDKGDRISSSSLALDWEFIENTLHKDNFWYFLQKRGTDMVNRIDLVFSLLYKSHVLASVDDEALWDSKLAEIDRDLGDTTKSTIFRFYYDRFEGLDETSLHDAVADAWDEVMELFRMLDDWYCTPSLYNTVGLLSQMGEDLSHLVVKFSSMGEDSTQVDFREYLLSRVRHHLRGVDVDVDGRRILTEYASRNHGLIFNLLLTLNIHILNLQNSRFESESDIYKFPFDVLSYQQWDIEHIDSFHTNQMKKESEKVSWIESALSDVPDLSDEDRERVCAMVAGKNYEGAITLLKRVVEEADADEKIKNSIGNLTLLDSSTNRNYGNSLFCTKRRIIIERMKQGIFVPVGTQYIFYKFFDQTGTNRSKWTMDDMVKYQSYLYDMLESYIAPDNGGDA